MKRVVQVGMRGTLRYGVVLWFGLLALSAGAAPWALWDGEGQHLTTEEILTMHRDYGAGIYFFRYETRHGLDLARLRAAGITTIKVAHPGYAPFNNVAFLSDEAAVREWARLAAANPAIDGLALDMEGMTATTHKEVMRWLSEEARSKGKSMHLVPHFVLFDRWEDTPSPEEVNRYCDVVWPWLYNRFRKAHYADGVLAMLAYWKEQGVTLPTNPVVDHGRESYSGITPTEAAEVAGRLRKAGIETVCLFQPHVSFRERGASVPYGALWDGLGALDPR